MARRAVKVKNQDPVAGAGPAQECGSDLLRVVRRVPDVTLGEPRLLACPINERLRHAQSGGRMFIVETPSGNDVLRLPSRKVAAGPTCSAQVTATTWWSAWPPCAVPERSFCASLG